MFHDQHVLRNGMYLLCCSFFYVLPRASYGYIQCGFIPSVVWRFSKYYFQLFRCRNLALNRFFLLFLRGRYVHTWEVSVCPLYIWMPSYVQTPPVHSVALLMPPYVQTPPISPMLPCASVCSRGYLHVIMGRWGHPYVWTLPCVWIPPYVSNTPTHYMLPYMSVCSRGYCMHYGEHPIYWGAAGGFSTCQAFGICQYIHWMTIMLHLVPFL